MRIRVLLKANGIESYATNPNYALNCAIYKYMNMANKDLADIIHNTGYKSGKRFYKPFCFTRPRFESIKCITDQNNERQIFVTGYADWLISSPYDEIMMAIIDGMAKTKALEIENAKFSIVNIDTEPEPQIESGARFFALSPIVTKKATETGKARFLTPLEDEFYESLAENAKRKVKLITGKEYDFKFEMASPEKFDIKKAYKKSYYIDSPREGYIFPIRIFGDVDAIRYLYDFGVGALNCQGFGMISDTLKVVC